MDTFLPICLRFLTGKGTRAWEIDGFNELKSSGIINTSDFWDYTTSLVLTGEANSLE